MHRTALIATLSLLLVLIIMAGLVNSAVGQPDMSKQDIYYSFVEGQRLLNGQNPYARILEGDMLHNRKYATYFPLFYELSFLTQKAGLSTFEAWLAFWRIVFIAFEFSIALVLYLALARLQLPWVGLFAAAFWLFNRWTLQLVQIADLDFVPIFFLLLSLELLSRNKWLSLVSLGLSLAIKQIAIFIVPLYLIWLWQASEKQRLKDVLVGAAIIGGIPFLSALPFLIWGARGFVYSVLFSVTRLPEQSRGLPGSVGSYLSGGSTIDKIAMLGLMFTLYVFAWRRLGTRYLLALLVMLVFVCFNSVLYPQYILWLMPLSLLLFCDLQGIRAPRPPATAES